MSDLLKNASWYIMRGIRTALLHMLQYIPGVAKEMFNEVVALNPSKLRPVPDDFKTQELCNKAVALNPYMLNDVPDHFKTQ